MNSYIEGLKEALESLHNCKATHLESVPVKEEFQGATVWEGVVEVFKVEGHPKADKCYVWGYAQGGETKMMAVLDMPPVHLK